jgi:hypothetical protein
MTKNKNLIGTAEVGLDVTNSYEDSMPDYGLHITSINLPETLKIPGYELQWIGLTVMGKKTNEYAVAWRKGFRDVTREDHPELVEHIMGPAMPGTNANDPVVDDAQVLMKIPTARHKIINEDYRRRAIAQKESANMFNKNSTGLKSIDKSKSRFARGNDILFGD